MREFSRLHDKKLVSLLDALKLEAEGGEDDYGIGFYIDGMNDYIVAVDTYDDEYTEVTTYSKFRDARSATDTAARDLSSAPTDHEKTFERLVKIVIGCYERFLKLKLKEKLANARARKTL